MDTQTALQAIQEQPLAPVYLVLGTESFLIDKIKAAFFSRLQLQKDDLDFVFFDMEEDLVNVPVAEAALDFCRKLLFSNGGKENQCPRARLRGFIELSGAS